MNAKFEKWYVERYGYQPRKLITARTAWQAAIQSLEVTDDLVTAAKDAIFGSSDYQPGYGGFIGHDAVEETVRAVLSALKEQAK